MPNTLNVMTNFPFLIIGVLGFVLCVGGSFFNIRFPLSFLSKFEHLRFFFIASQLCKFNAV